MTGKFYVQRTHALLVEEQDFPAKKDSHNKTRRAFQQLQSRALLGIFFFFSIISPHLHTSQKKLKSAFWLTNDSMADDVVLGTATLAGGGGDGGGDVATEATLVLVVLVVLVDVSDEDELLLLLLLELELLLLLELELELALDSCALTALASFEMFEWHCAVVFWWFFFWVVRQNSNFTAGNNKNSLFWVSQSDTLKVAAPLVLAILAQLFFWLSQLLPAASVKLVNVSPETSNGRVLSPDCVTFLGGQFPFVFSSPQTLPKKVHNYSPHPPGSRPMPP